MVVSKIKGNSVYKTLQKGMYILEIRLAVVAGTKIVLSRTGEGFLFIFAF